MPLTTWRNSPPPIPAQTALLNQAITVGEIDFGTTKNININGDGISGHTLTLSATAGNAVLNVGAAPFTNTGIDVIAAPLVVAAASPLTATVSGGTLQLSNTGATANVIDNASTFTVNTNGILEGSADPTNPALGSAAVVLSGGTMQLDAAATAASTLANAVSVNAAASSTLTTTGINGISLPNAVTFGGSNDNLTVTGPAPLTLGTLSLANGGDTFTQNGTGIVTVNAITGSLGQALTLAGTGTVALPNASAGDAAPTILSEATVVVGDSSSLGSGDITVAGADTLQATNAVTLANNFTINSSSTLTVSGANNITLAGVVSSESAGAGSLVMAGSGTLALQGVNTFSGDVTASTGTIAVSASGTDVGVTSFTVDANATLLVDNSVTNVNNRLGTSSASAAALNLAGGTFTLNGNATAATTEQVADITVQSGYSTVNLNKGAGGTLSLGANTLAANTTLTGVAPFVNLVGALTGSSPGDQLNFTTNPTLTNGILPYATVTNGANYDFATVATNSLAAFAAYDATTLGAVTGTNTAVVKLTGNDATMPAAGVAPYAVIVQGNATVTGAGTLTTSTLALGGTDTLNLPVNVGALGTVVANAGAIATFDGVISGTALDVAGAGTTILNNADTYTGPTTLESGTLSVGNPTGLGSGALNLLGGTIQASIAATVTNDVNLTNSLGTVTFGGNTPLTFSGTTTLAGNNTVTVANTGGTTLAGQVTGSGGLTVTAVSTGTLALTNSSSSTPNDYTTGTTLLGGNLVLGASSVLGSGPLTLGGGTLLASAAVTPTNAVTINGAVTFAGSNPITLSGATTLAGAPVVTVNNATTLSGVISSNSAGLTLAAASRGTLTLGNSANTYFGGTTLNGGTLSIASPGALGTGTLTLAGAANGATLTATAALTGGNSVTNPVALAGLGTLSGSAINFSGATTLSAPSTLTVNNSTTFAGIIGGAATLTTAGSGTLTLTAANTYSGATFVNGGTLTLSGANGAIASSSSLTVNNGGTVLLDNSGVNNNTRLGTSADINLNGGTFQVNGNASTALSESLGTLTLGAGSSTLASNPGAAGGTLTFAGLSRAAGSGGFVNFTGTNLGSTNQVNFTGLTNTGGLLPYATVNGGDFAATTATGIQSYTASGGTYASTVSGASSGANVNLAGSDTVTSSQTINALMFSGTANATLTINAGVTLTIASGACSSIAPTRSPSREAARWRWARPSSTAAPVAR